MGLFIHSDDQGHVQTFPNLPENLSATLMRRQGDGKNWELEPGVVPGEDSRQAAEPAGPRDQKGGDSG